MFDEVEEIDEVPAREAPKQDQQDDEEKHISSISVETPIQKIKYACYANCYKKIYDDFIENPYDFQKAWKLNELKRCTSLCKSETKNVKSHLPNIEKETSKQLQQCTNKCIEQAKIFQPQPVDPNNKEQNEENDPKAQYGKCLWKCYNSLDKKYQNIWVEKEDKK